MDQICALMDQKISHSYYCNYDTIEIFIYVYFFGVSVCKEAVGVVGGV